MNEIISNLIWWTPQIICTCARWHYHDLISFQRMIFQFNHFSQLIVTLIHLFAALYKAFRSFIAISRHIDVIAYFIFKFPFMPIWKLPFAEKAKKVFNTKPIRNSQHPMTKTEKPFQFYLFFIPLHPLLAIFFWFCLINTQTLRHPSVNLNYHVSLYLECIWLNN